MVVSLRFTNVLGDDDPMKERVFGACMAVLDNYLGDEGRQSGSYQWEKINAGKDRKGRKMGSMMRLPVRRCIMHEGVRRARRWMDSKMDEQFGGGIDSMSRQMCSRHSMMFYVCLTKKILIRGAGGTM
jgi:hypothetical protein